MARRTRTAFVVRRLLSALPVLFGVVVVTFLLTRLLPGDPAAFFTSAPGAGAAEIEEVRRTLGLDKSLAEQFVIYLRNLAEGDLGRSLVTGQPVTQDLLGRLPASLELTLVAFLIACAVALPLGVMAALRPGSWIDHVCRLISTAGISLPVFVTGLLLIYIFYFHLGWVPDPVGRLDVFMTPPPRITGLYVVDGLIAAEGETVIASIRQLLLPSATMAIFSLAPLARMARASMLGVLGSDFIRTARAMGLSKRDVIWSYAIRNALLPVITILGMVFSYMLGANILVEKVFAWPGIGYYALSALVSLDYAPVQGFVLMMAFLFVLLNLCIDILYGLVDPRVGLEA
jgi:peptide/nickel transport system permease protein